MTDASTAPSEVKSSLTTIEKAINGANSAFNRASSASPGWTLHAQRLDGDKPDECKLTLLASKEGEVLSPMTFSGRSLIGTEEEVNEIARLLEKEFCPRLREQLTLGGFQPTDASTWVPVETNTGQHFQVRSTGTPERTNEQSGRYVIIGTHRTTTRGRRTSEDLLIRAEVRRLPRKAVLPSISCTEEKRMLEVNVRNEI